MFPVAPSKGAALAKAKPRATRKPRAFKPVISTQAPPATVGEKLALFSTRGALGVGSSTATQSSFGSSDGGDDILPSSSASQLPAPAPPAGKKRWAADTISDAKRVKQLEDTFPDRQPETPTVDMMVEQVAATQVAATRVAGMEVEPAPLQATQVVGMAVGQAPIQAQQVIEVQTQS